MAIVGRAAYQTERACNLFVVAQAKKPMADSMSGSLRDLSLG